MLQITPLKDINDVRLNTTLLSSRSSLFASLQNASVVAMIQGGKLVPVKQGIGQKKSTGFSIWKDHPYKTFGDQADSGTEDPQNVSTLLSNGNMLAEKLATPIGRWVQQDSSEYEDAFKPALNSELPEMLADISQTIPPPNSSPPKPITRRARTVRGAIQKTNPIPPTALVPAPPKVKSLIDHQEESQIISEDMPLIKLQAPSPRDVDPATSRVNGAPKIEPPYMPPSKNHASTMRPPGYTGAILDFQTMSNLDDLIKWEGKVVHGDKGGRLLDLKENEDKMSSHKKKDLRYTMNQKKPQQRLTGSQTEMMKNFEKAARQMLVIALPLEGPLNFEVGIGRLLVNPQNGSSEFKRPFAMTEWSSVFPVKDGVNKVARTTTFTPQLTTRPSDIDSILNLRQPQRRALFNSEVHKRTVIYVITCTTKSNDLIIIRVCEDGSFTVQGSEILVGAINWHYPLRMWDTRLQLTTKVHQFSDYSKQAKGIVDHMKIQIPTDGKTIHFSTTTIDQELMIQSVLLRRETAHASTAYPDLLLHLTEVQDMDVKQLPGIGVGYHYHGIILVPAKMISAAKTWWEASITSVTATEVLKANDNLEFGERAEWSPESIIGAGVIRDLYSLADEIVTNIDHVGYYNKGSHSHSNPRSGTRESPGMGDLVGPLGMARLW